MPAGVRPVRLHHADGQRQRRAGGGDRRQASSRARRSTPPDDRRLSKPQAAPERAAPTWSRDSRRLFLRTTGVCQGVPLATSAIFSISTSGRVDRRRGHRRARRTTVRVARFRDVGVPAGLPPDVATAVRRTRWRARAPAPPSARPCTSTTSSTHCSSPTPTWSPRGSARAHSRSTSPRATSRNSIWPASRRGVADALTAIADSNAMLARATDEPSVVRARHGCRRRSVRERVVIRRLLSAAVGLGCRLRLLRTRGGAAGAVDGTGAQGHGGNAAQGNGGNAPEGRGGGAPEGRGTGGTVRLGGAPR